VNLDRIEKIAEAVLYEGYMLYPYRPSSVKNQQRWNFGVLYPPSWCEHQTGSDRCSFQTVCLLKADSSTRLTVKVRFLQIVQRSIGKLRVPGVEAPEGAEPAMEFVDRLEMAERVYMPWQEAVEREVAYTALDPEALSYSGLPFSFPEGKTFEYLRDEHGIAAGVIVREWKALSGSVEIQPEICRDEVVKVTVRVQNLIVCDIPAALESSAREAVLVESLVSAHTILGAENGEFISLLDPPAGFEDLAAQCNNVGTWPVLAGDDATGMLSSPIILYDYPKIAPESAGNLFDSTEIDEILSLRILTLTDAEKREMRQSDDRTRGILERTENMSEEQFMKLHGVLRGLTVLKEELR
jgi:hypothetical protein